jgi:hypothetical protein
MGGVQWIILNVETQETYLSLKGQTEKIAKWKQKIREGPPRAIQSYLLDIWKFCLAPTIPPELCQSLIVWN